MRLLLLAQLRFLARAPWSALTAVLGVALAVASVVAVHQIGTAVSRSLDAARPPHLAGISHLLERPALTATHYFELRSAWRASHWPAVTALVPIVEGHLDVAGRRTLVLGADWLAYAGAGGAGDVAAAGAGRGEPGNAGAMGGPGLPGWRMLDGAAVVADRSLGVTAGDTLTIGGAAFEVVGVVDGGLGPTLYADIAVAQRLLDRSPDALSFIGVAAYDPWADWRRILDALMPGFAAGLPEPQVPSHQMVAGFQGRAIASELPAAAFARAILFNLGALGLLALLVAWFLVHQVALIWVDRQRPVFARLHALGVARASLAAGFVASFVVLGVLATLAGTGSGLWLARVLIDITAPDGAGAALPVHPDAVLFGKAILSGVGICFAGGWLAIARDGARSPLRQRYRAWARWLLLAAAVALLVIGVANDATGLFGGFGAILAMSLLTVAAIRPLLEWLRPGPVAAEVRRGTAGASRAPGAARLLARLAMREAVWRPEVVTVALAALTLAVATSMGVGLMVESLRADFSRMMTSRLSGDLYVSGPVGVVDEAARWLAAAAPGSRIIRHGEVQVRVARGDGADQGKPADLGFSEFDAAESARYGHAGQLGPHEALINERLARDLGVAAAGTVVVAGVPLVVAHVFSGFGDPRPRLLVDTAALAALGLPPVVDRLSVHLSGAAGADRERGEQPHPGPSGRPLAAPAADPGAALAAHFPLLEVTAREAVRSRALELFDRTFAMTRALTLLALLVAGVGIYNALTALRLSQSATRRLLEAQGASRQELALVTLVRSCSVGVIAVVVATPLGIAMAWTLCAVINPRAFGWTIGLELAPGGWLTPLALGLAATVLAGLLPAPREQGELDEAG